MNSAPLNVRCFLLTVAALGLTPAAALAMEYQVQVVSDYDNLRMAFEPDHLKVSVGDQVTWVNEADEEHDIITYPNGFPEGAAGFQSPRMTDSGQTYSVTFSMPGTYEYHCTPHMILGMRGTIIVDEPSNPSAMHRPTRDEVLAYRTVLLEFFDEEELEDFGIDNVSND